MRGYDRHQVDEHIRQLEGEVRQHRDQSQAMRRELSDAHRQIQEQERPTYSGLGARIEQLLRLASAFDLAWCTGWEDKANDYLPLALGLPGPLPVVEFDPAGRPSRAHWKLGGIERGGNSLKVAMKFPTMA